MNAKSDRDGVVIEQKDLAIACGVTQQAVSLWMSSKTKGLRSDHLFAAAEWLGVSPYWLGTGKGPMVASKSLDIEWMDDAQLASIRALIDAYARLPRSKDPKH